MTLRLASIFSLFLWVSLSGCKRGVDPVIRAMKVSQSWISDFEGAFPDPIPPFEEAPRFARTGDLGAAEHLTFMLVDFPEARLAEVEEFFRSRWKDTSIRSATIHVMVPDPEYDDPRIIKGFTAIRYHADGRTEVLSSATSGSALPKLNFKGEPVE